MQLLGDCAVELEEVTITNFANFVSFSRFFNLSAFQYMYCFLFPGIGVASGVGAGVAIGYVGAQNFSTATVVASTHAINLGANVTQGVLTGVSGEVIKDTVDVKVGRKGMK